MRRGGILRGIFCFINTGQYIFYAIMKLRNIFIVLHDKQEADENYNQETNEL